MLNIKLSGGPRERCRTVFQVGMSTIINQKGGCPGYSVFVFGICSDR